MPAILTRIRNFLHELQRESLQNIGVIFFHEESHEVGARVELEFNRAIQVFPVVGEISHRFDQISRVFVRLKLEKSMKWIRQ